MESSTRTRTGAFAALGLLGAFTLSDSAHAQTKGLIAPGTIKPPVTVSNAPYPSGTPDWIFPSGSMLFTDGCNKAQQTARANTNSMGSIGNAQQCYMHTSHGYATLTFGDYGILRSVTGIDEHNVGHHYDLTTSKNKLVTQTGVKYYESPAPSASIPTNAALDPHTQMYVDGRIYNEVGNIVMEMNLPARRYTIIFKAAGLLLETVSIFFKSAENPNDKTGGNALVFHDVWVGDEDHSEPAVQWDGVSPAPFAIGHGVKPWSIDYYAEIQTRFAPRAALKKQISRFYNGWAASSPLDAFAKIHQVRQGMPMNLENDKGVRHVEAEVANAFAQAVVAGGIAFLGTSETGVAAVLVGAGVAVGAWDAAMIGSLITDWENHCLGFSCDGTQPQSSFDTNDLVHDGDADYNDGVQNSDGTTDPSGDAPPVAVASNEPPPVHYFCWEDCCYLNGGGECLNPADVANSDGKPVDQEALTRAADTSPTTTPTHSGGKLINAPE